MKKEHTHGECKWFKKRDANKNYGNCACPLPPHVFRITPLHIFDIVFYEDDDIKDCPCFTPYRTYGNCLQATNEKLSTKNTKEQE